MVARPASSGTLYSLSVNCAEASAIAPKRVTKLSLEPRLLVWYAEPSSLVGRLMLRVRPPKWMLPSASIASVRGWSSSAPP